MGKSILRRQVEHQRGLYALPEDEVLPANLESNDADLAGF